MKVMVHIHLFSVFFQVPLYATTYNIYMYVYVHICIYTYLLLTFIIIREIILTTFNATFFYSVSFSFPPNFFVRLLHSVKWIAFPLDITLLVDVL